MVEKARRSAVGDAPRGGDQVEWEVFVREDESDPMRHVGSVTAPTAEIAHQQASRLFAWFASDVWCCPATEVRRYSTHDLDDEFDAGGDGADGSDGGDRDGAAGHDHGDGEERRVYEA